MLPVGSPAIGSDFVDREREVTEIRSILEKDSVLLIAPRRFGKTSVMRQLEKLLLDEEKICVFLDVEDISCPKRFFSEIVLALVGNEAIGGKVSPISKFKKVFEWFKDIEALEISVLKAKLRTNVESDLGTDWRHKSSQIFDIIGDLDSVVYLIFDEFPIAISNMDPSDAKHFLQWFRQLRQVSKNLRFIVGGSVSIDTTVRNVGGLTLINDFKRVKIGGFSREVALTLIETVFREEGWGYTKPLGQQILACIGDAIIPYFVAIMLSAIKDEIVLRPREVDETLIKNVYSSRILGSEGKSYFEHYSQRLKIVYPEMEAKAAKAILSAVCSSDEYYPLDLAFGIFKRETGSVDHGRFMDLIANLGNDFYITYDSNKRLKFYSNMLRDWWRVYYGAGK